MSKTISEASQSIISIYWDAYGGFYALIRSKYLWAAILITLVLHPQWSAPNWWEDVISIIPSLLGFSLGGFAIWLAIGDEDFRQTVAGREQNEGASPFMVVNASFVHFIALQILSIFLALIAEAYYFVWEDKPEIGFLNEIVSKLYLVTPLAHYLCYFVFVYALMSAIAATFALLRGAHWYDIQQTHNKSQHLESQ